MDYTSKPDNNSMKFMSPDYQSFNGRVNLKQNRQETNSATNGTPFFVRKVLQFKTQTLIILDILNYLKKMC